jgi:hypothetical protein
MSPEARLGPGRFFQFLNLIHSRQGSLERGSVRRKADINIGKHEYEIKAQRHQ